MPKWLWVLILLCFIAFVIGIVLDEVQIHSKFQLISPFINRSGTNGIVNTPPTITNIEISNLTPTSAIVKWSTLEKTTGRVTYCRPNSTCGASDIDPILKSAHEIKINDLLPDTMYDLTLTCIDAKQNQIDFKLDNCFTTPPLKTTPNVSSAPNISNITENLTSKRISWMTDKPTNCQLIIWSEPTDKTTVASNIQGTNHTVSLDPSKIISKRTYYYMIVASDANGNINTSETRTFIAK